MDGSWRSFGLTHQGRVRDHNEDALLDLHTECCWVVADGMGGHSKGDLASRMIVDHLSRYQRSALPGSNIRKVDQALQQVNQRLVQLAGDDPNEIIGSTVAVLLIHQQHYFSIWAGDSRIYRYRNQSLTQITRDHDETQRLIDTGMTSEQVEQLQFAPAITKAIGAEDLLELEVQMQELFPEDLFLLCSDGLNKEVTDEEISEMLASHSPEQAAQHLLQLALDREARDNVTVMVVYP